MNASDKTNCILHGAYLWSNYMNASGVQGREVTLRIYKVWEDRYNSAHPDWILHAQMLNTQTMDWVLAQPV